MLHFGEEPVISGTRGSGTVFFSGCTMDCVFCQNHLISRSSLGDDARGSENSANNLLADGKQYATSATSVPEKIQINFEEVPSVEKNISTKGEVPSTEKNISTGGKAPLAEEKTSRGTESGFQNCTKIAGELTPEALAAVFFELKNAGAHNINLVSATPAIPLIAEALIKYPPGIPVIWNSSGYEKVEALRMLEGLVQVYLPDLKYVSQAASIALSKHNDYFKHAFAAISEMLRQQPETVIEDGTVRRGVIVRHLIVPGFLKESAEVVKIFAENFKDSAWFSLMAQYTPPAELGLPPAVGAHASDINRRLKPIEYHYALRLLERNGIENGFVQELSASGTELIPDFETPSALAPNAKLIADFNAPAPNNKLIPDFETSSALATGTEKSHKKPRK
jgi:putative pyruvate formate lyase activating enzyme